MDSGAGEASKEAAGICMWAHFFPQSQEVYGFSSSLFSPCLRDKQWWGDFMLRK